jgi:hypothetical protein
MDVLADRHALPHKISQSTDYSMIVQPVSGKGDDALKIANEIQERGHPAAASVRFIQFVPKRKVRLKACNARDRLHRTSSRQRRLGVAGVQLVSRRITRIAAALVHGRLNHRALTARGPARRCAGVTARRAGRRSLEEPTASRGGVQDLIKEVEEGARSRHLQRLPKRHLARSSQQARH